MSDVEVSPSTVTALKLGRTAAVSAFLSIEGATAASVVITPIMVAIDGAIMPAPLTIPATIAALPPSLVVTTDDFSRVSVVMIARNAAESLRVPRLLAAAAMPRLIFVIGSRWPIMPVEATSTFRGSVPRRAAVSAAIVRASRIPRLPVQTFETPALITIPRALP